MDGLSFRINDFRLRITWSWQDQVPTMYNNSVIPLIKMEFGLWYDYYYNEDKKTYILDEYQLLDGQWELKNCYKLSNRFDIHHVILENTEKELELTANPNFISDVYVVFIPGYYLDPKYSSEKVESFLNQSEFYYAHDAAIQSNVDMCTLCSSIKKRCIHY